MDDVDLCYLPATEALDAASADFPRRGVRGARQRLHLHPLRRGARRRERGGAALSPGRGSRPPRRPARRHQGRELHRGQADIERIADDGGLRRRSVLDDERAHPRRRRHCACAGRTRSTSPPCARSSCSRPNSNPSAAGASPSRGTSGSSRSTPRSSATLTELRASTCSESLPRRDGSEENRPRYGVRVDPRGGHRLSRPSLRRVHLEAARRARRQDDELRACVRRVLPRLQPARLRELARGRQQDVRDARTPARGVPGPGLPDNRPARGVSSCGKRIAIESGTDNMRIRPALSSQKPVPRHALHHEVRVFVRGIIGSVPTGARILSVKPRSGVHP